jgi:Asp-tRNA(Asn)/Glu-tRNA(Gln) amidotransferase A subunit family amidase
MGPSMEAVDPEDPRFMGYTRQFLRMSSEAFRRTGVYTGMEMETEVHLALARVFAEYDALVCPTFGGLGLRAGDEYADGLDVAGQHLELYIFAALTPVFNVASRHPVLSVPSGLAPNGVPTGVQVVARPYDDVTAFHVGAAAERELGLWHDPSWRPSL